VADQGSENFYRLGGSSSDPRQAADCVRDLVAVLAKLIVEAPKEHRDGLRAIIYEQLIGHVERIAATPVTE
jgi:hypothetical protein